MQSTKRSGEKARHTNILIIGATVMVGLSLVAGGAMAQDGKIAWEGHGDEHIEGCESGFHWIFTPGGGVENVTLHWTANNTTGSTPMVQKGESDQGAWHADTTLVDLEEGVTPNVTFDGEAHREAKLVISHCLDEQEEEPCIGPEGVSATTASDPLRNMIEWDNFTGATSYNVYRATEGGNFSLLAETNESMYTDFDVEAHTTYQYRVTANTTEGETDACETVEVTTIPVFSTLATGALAAVLGVGAYVVARRRK